MYLYVRIRHSSTLSIPDLGWVSLESLHVYMNIRAGAIFQEPKGPTNWSQYDHTSMLVRAPPPRPIFALSSFIEGSPFRLLC